MSAFLDVVLFALSLAGRKCMKGGVILVYMFEIKQTSKTLYV